MDKLGGLLSHSLNKLRMAVSRIDYGDTGISVNILSAVNVFEDRPFPLNENRGDQLFNAGHNVDSLKSHKLFRGNLVDQALGLQSHARAASVSD